jgi:hypothetical protein
VRTKLHQTKSSAAFVYALPVKALGLHIPPMLLALVDEVMNDPPKPFDGFGRLGSFWQNGLFRHRADCDRQNVSVQCVVSLLPNTGNL